MIEGQINAAYRTACSHTYVCPRCGRQWARLSFQPGAHWIVHTAHCAECGTPWPSEIAGSLSNLIEARIDGHGCAHLPLDLLVRELDLLEGVDRPTVSRHTSPIVSTIAPLMNNELAAKIAELRSKVLTNTITAAELREGIRLLRAERNGAAERRTETKAKAAPVDGAALLAKMLGNQ